MKGIENIANRESAEKEKVLRETKNELDKLKFQLYPLVIHKGIWRMGGSMKILWKEGKPSFWDKALAKLIWNELLYFKKGKLGLEISYTGGGMDFETPEKTQYFEITFFVAPELEEGMANIQTRPRLIKLWIDVEDLDLSSPEAVAKQLMDKIVANNREGKLLRDLIDFYIEDFIKDLWISKQSMKLEKEWPENLVLYYERWGKTYPLIIRKNGEKSITLNSPIITGYPTSITIENIQDVNDFNIKLGEALDLLLGKLRDRIPDIGAEIYNYFFGNN